MSFLINKSFFTIGNMVFKQEIGIPVGVDPAPFYAYLFLYFFAVKYIKQLISNGSSNAYKYHGVYRFIDDLCTINGDNVLITSFRNIYAKELELKVEHLGCNASFLDFDIKIEDNVFVYKLKNAPFIKQCTI